MIIKAGQFWSYDSNYGNPSIYFHVGNNHHYSACVYGVYTHDVAIDNPAEIQIDSTSVKKENIILINIKDVYQDKIIPEHMKKHCEMFRVGFNIVVTREYVTASLP